MISNDVEEFLKHPNDQDVLQKFELSIIEDSSLDGATWREARTKFDRGAWEQVKDLGVRDIDLDFSPMANVYRCAREMFVELDTTLVQPAKTDGKIPLMTKQQLAKIESVFSPRWAFFIWAGNASVDSVVDHADAMEREELGCYYFTVVMSNFTFREARSGHSKFFLDYEDYTHWLEETQRKYKAWDLVDVCALIADDRWQYGSPQSADGIYEAY